MGVTDATRRWPLGPHLVQLEEHTMRTNTMSAYASHITANISVHTKHTTHYTVAMAFIQAHGHFAALTRDGLLTMSLEWADEMPVAMPDATDFKVEVPMVFEVDDAGMVSSREVREWLGY